MINVPSSAGSLGSGGRTRRNTRSAYASGLDEDLDETLDETDDVTEARDVFIFILGGITDDTRSIARGPTPLPGAHA
jgi:hypothetical protein